MKYVELRDDEVLVTVDAGDLNMILSMINETLECVEDFELQARSGFSRDEIKNFRRTIEDIESKLIEKRCNEWT